MRGFVNGEVDVLVSTMIVESGLDPVPNANTMVVHDAHKAGLAQLYQVRGRVGRSHRRAYCYLIAPDLMDPVAEERLKVLEHHTDLGAGYRIALKDLEIRGAGNLLGAEQSGHAHAIGFDLYPPLARGDGSGQSPLLRQCEGGHQQAGKQRNADGLHRRLPSIRTHCVSKVARGPPPPTFQPPRKVFNATEAAPGERVRWVRAYSIRFLMS